MRSIGNFRLLTLSAAGVVVGVVLLAGCQADPPVIPPVEDPAPELPADDTADRESYGSVQHADESNFEALVLQAKGPVLVDFYADWCGPCKIQAPILEDFARDRPDLLIVKVDVDQAPGLARQYAITSIPSLKVFRDGEVVDQHLGVANRDRLASLLGS